jgi:hypothetical protein
MQEHGLAHATEPGDELAFGGAANQDASQRHIHVVNFAGTPGQFEWSRTGTWAVGIQHLVHKGNLCRR